MLVDKNEYGIGSLFDWTNQVINFNSSRKLYELRYPISFIDYGRNLRQHCKDSPVIFLLPF
jgi:hypothetical protein